MIVKALKLLEEWEEETHKK
ncbi:MAG: hypothetical protein RMZ43_016050 [Nostoc sp. CmiVER01]